MASVPVIDLRRREASTMTDAGTNDTILQDEGGCSNANDETEDEEFVRLATELVQALEQWGFVTLVNHGISCEAIRSALGVSRQFFSLDESAKNRCAYRGHDCNCGYIGVGQESHATGAADAKETFDIGPEPVSPGGGGAGGETPWPVDQEDGFSGERFKSTMVSYFDECNRLQLHLLKLIAVGLGLPSPDYLAAQCNERHCNLRLLRYPSHRVKVSHGTLLKKATGDKDKQLDERVIVRGARHTDFGTLTVLAQDDVGGLRVQPRRHPMGEPSDAPWIHVAPVEGALVLNVGDMLQRWTNDRLVATPHQVVSVLPPHEPAAPRMGDPNQGDDATTDVHIPERYSIAFFCNANRDTVLRPIPSLVRANEGPKYEAVTAKEYLTRRLTETIRPTTAS
jgi:isopenicillin N synthase-like dioxygenase